MSKITNIIFAGGTVTIALVTGYLMQAESRVRPATTQLASLDAASALDETAPASHGAAATRTSPVTASANAAVLSAIDKSLKRTTDLVQASGGDRLNSAIDGAGHFPTEPEENAQIMANLNFDRSVMETVLAKPNLMLAAQSSGEVAGSFELASASTEELAPDFSPAEASDCQAFLTSDPTAAAMVQLNVMAPCSPNERLTVHHNGMMFTDVTDAAGNLSLKVPALAEAAVFMVSFASGQTLVSQTEVTSLGFYDRAVVQWKGDISLQIHALEFGADYGEEGHIWAEEAGSLKQAVSGERGFITRLGDPDAHEALHVEVYTFPTGTSKHEGDVVLSVEAEVTASNCGRDVEAQSIQFSHDTSLRVQDLVLQMPACDEFGGYLVLKNLLEDLTIALK